MPQRKGDKYCDEEIMVVVTYPDGSQKKGTYSTNGQYVEYWKIASAVAKEQFVAENFLTHISRGRMLVLTLKERRGGKDRRDRGGFLKRIFQFFK